MAVLSNPKDVSRLNVPFPLIIQEFVNHGGVIYKVYVMGSKHWVQTRPSLSNMARDCEFQVFDSQKMKSLKILLAEEEVGAGIRF